MTATRPISEAAYSAAVRALAGVEPEPATEDGAWECPVELDAGAVPPFPVDALPATVADYVRAVAAFAEVPADLPAVLALAVGAAAVARKVAVAVRLGYREPLNLFGVVAMPPGTRKSSTFADVTAPLLAYERELQEQLGPKIARAQSEARVRAKELSDAEGRLAKATGEERTRLEAEVQGLALAVRTAVVPAEPRVLMGEATPEAVAAGLAEQGGRLAVFSPEGDVFGLLRRYSKDGAANFEVYLKGHAGDELRVDRRGAPPLTVPEPALTVALTVQPHVLHGLARDPIFRERGLLARFLYAVPVSTVGERTFDGPPVPPDVRTRYAELVTWLCRWPGQGEPLTLAPDAYDTWHAFALAIEQDRGPGGRFAGLLDWSGKAPGLAARLAGVLHAVDGAAAGRIAPTIEAPTMAAAVTLGEYVAAHALAAFGMMGASAAHADAAAALEWIKRAGVATFTTRDTYRNNAALKPETAKAALQVLAERGWIRPAQDEKRPGRPAERWEAHPDLLAPA